MAVGQIFKPVVKTAANTQPLRLKERIRKHSLFSPFFMVGVMFGVIACGGNYYKVVDPPSDKTYYTNNIKRGFK